MKKIIVITVLPFLLSFSGNDAGKECIATWYNKHGARTSSGIKMHRDSLTAAYNSVPLHSKLKIINLSNDKICIVKVTDRMGNKSPNRIDLSYKAFGEIANHSQGRIKVVVIKIK
jgi:rare lipoprotein A